MKNISVFFLFLSVNCFGLNVSDKTIARVHVTLGSGYYFRTNESMIDVHDCGSTAWYTVKENTYSKEAFSLILAAKMARKKIQFHLNGCRNGYPAIDWINVYE